MKEKINVKKIIGLLGVFFFVLSMMISQIPSNAVANDSDIDENKNCSGSNIQCVSHLPERLP